MSRKNFDLYFQEDLNDLVWEALDHGEATKEEIRERLERSFVEHRTWQGPSQSTADNKENGYAKQAS